MHLLRTENKCQLVLTNIYTKLINVSNPSTRPQYNLNINQTREELHSYNGLYHNMSERSAAVSDQIVALQYFEHG